MKLQIISENDLTKAAQKLNQQVTKLGVADLDGLVKDPHDAVELIRRGMTAQEFIFSDDEWVITFLEQWVLLDENVIEQIYHDIEQEILQKAQQMRKQSESILIDDSVLFEGALSGVGGFLSKLGKFAMLLMKLLIASGGGGNSINARSLTELRVLNPYSVYRLTKDLQITSQKVLKTKKKQQNKQNLIKIQQAQGKGQQNVP